MLKEALEAWLSDFTECYVVNYRAGAFAQHHGQIKAKENIYSLIQTIILPVISLSLYSTAGYNCIYVRPI